MLRRAWDALSHAAIIAPQRKERTPWHHEIHPNWHRCNTFAAPTVLLYGTLLAPPLHNGSVNTPFLAPYMHACNSYHARSYHR